MSRQTFSFSSPDVLSVSLNGGVRLKIRVESICTACVFFVNENGEKVDIPCGISIFNETCDSIVEPVYNSQYFILGWTSTYKVFFEKKLILSAVDNVDFTSDWIFTDPCKRKWSVYIEQ